MLLVLATPGGCGHCGLPGSSFIWPEVGDFLCCVVVAAGHKHLTLPWWIKPSLHVSPQSVAFGSSSRKKWFGLPTLSTPVRCLSGCPLSPDVTTLFIVVTQSVPGCHWYSHSQSFQLIKQQLMHKLGHIICVVTLSNWVFLVLQQTPSSRRPDQGWSDPAACVQVECYCPHCHWG